MKYVYYGLTISLDFFYFLQDEHQSSYFFRGDEKCICYDDKTTLNWIKNKIQQVMVLGYEDKPLK